jgi:hypothetical protein
MQLYFVDRRTSKVFSADVDSVMAGYTHLKSQTVPAIAVIALCFITTIYALINAHLRSILMM